MAAGTQRTIFGSMAEANCSHPQGLRKALHIGKSLKTASMQWTDSGLMAMLQQTATLRVAAEQQIDVCLRATNAHQTGSGLMAVLQWMVKPSVVANWQTSMSP